MRPRRIIPPTAAALAAVLMAGCGYASPTASTGPAATTTTTTPPPVAGSDDFHEGDGLKPVRFPDGLQIVDLVVGTGAQVPANATVKVDYTGWLSDGTKFDSSRDRGQQLCVILQPQAQSQGDCTGVISGWDEGVPGMRVGGRRKVIIPPALGYGAQGAPPTIPANATLVFTIQIASIESTAPPSPTPSPAATSTPAPSPS